MEKRSLDTEIRHLEQMRGPRLLEELQSRDLDVLVPLGSLEQHGPHLPLGTDSIIARSMGHGLSDRFDDLVVAPCLPVGCSDHHLAFTGTVSVSADFVSSYLHAAISNLLGYGFRHAYVFSAHAGNNPAIEISVSALPHSLRQRTGAIADWPGQRAAMHRWAESSLGLDASTIGSHAGHIETSIMLYLEPTLVDMTAAQAGFVGSVEEATLSLAEDGMTAVSDIGVIGDPRTASREAGAGYLEIYTRSVADMIETHRSEPNT